LICLSSRGQSFAALHEYRFETVHLLVLNVAQLLQALGCLRGRFGMSLLNRWQLRRIAQLFTHSPGFYTNPARNGIDFALIGRIRLSGVGKL
jgi:hypothetical protein